MAGRIETKKKKKKEKMIDKKRNIQDAQSAKKMQNES